MFDQVHESLAQSLDKHGLPYMLIGGQAVLLYGEPRFTQDVDVTLGIGTERLDDLLAMIRDLDWQVLVEDPQTFTHKTMVLPCLAQPMGIRVDFIFSFTPYERQAIEHANRVKIGEAQVSFATLEDLIIHKLVAGRPRDLEDVRSLLAKNPTMDLAYMRRWLRQWEEILDRPFESQFEAIRKSLGLIP